MPSKSCLECQPWASYRSDKRFTFVIGWSKQLKRSVSSRPRRAPAKRLLSGATSTSITSSDIARASGAPGTSSRAPRDATGAITGGNAGAARAVDRVLRQAAGDTTSGNTATRTVGSSSTFASSGDARETGSPCRALGYAANSKGAGRREREEGSKAEGDLGVVNHGVYLGVCVCVSVAGRVGRIAKKAIESDSDDENTRSAMAGDRLPFVLSVRPRIVS